MRCRVCGRHIHYSYRKGRWYHYHRQHHWAIPDYREQFIEDEPIRKVEPVEQTNYTFWLIIIVMIIGAFLLGLKS